MPIRAIPTTLVLVLLAGSSRALAETSAPSGLSSLVRAVQVPGADAAAPRASLRAWEMNVPVTRVDPRPAAHTYTALHRAASPPRRVLGMPPALFGAVVGAAAGGAIAYGKWGAEGTFVGVFAGGGAGAFVGWLVTR